jgi:subtilisin family serine protease
VTLGGGKTVVLHDFGGGNTGNLMVDGSPTVDLFWADPLGAATNDYDLFILDSTGSTVKGVAMSGQNGMDPYLEVSIFDGNYNSPAAGDMIVIVRSTNSSPVAMHVETFGASGLLFGTAGSAHGHNAGANTQSMAATYWNSAHNGTKPFNGTNNPTEVFSSDGPRQIFFNPDGSAITPGNFRFSTNGGRTLQKPDFTAADGVTTRTGGEFNPFFGTSAACPHACGVAALIKSANPGLTNTQIRNIMVNTAHGIPTAGWNRDAGFGVLDVSAATQ